MLLGYISKVGSFRADKVALQRVHLQKAAKSGPTHAGGGGATGRRNFLVSNKNTGR